MARRDRRHADNVPGEFFVDRTCIDCGTCRRLAPRHFGEADDHHFVYRQPEGEAETRRAILALASCPTASIGTEHHLDAAETIRAFPERIAGEVHDCGFASRETYGAASYLVRRLEGNVLVDSPRATRPLLERIGEMGGVSLMVLTHRDDVGDHETFRRMFGCERILHRRDVTAETAGIERPIDGDETVRLAEDLVLIPTPGHTAGHVVLLYRDEFLFSGDHLAWSGRREGLEAFRDFCWHSWDDQIRSMERLLRHRFEWVLPGHGGRYHAPSAESMRSEVERCLAAMRNGA